MRYFSLLVLVEGASDKDFFPSILDRSVAELVCAKVEPMVQIAVDVEVVLADGAGRCESILKTVDRHHRGLTAVALHFDGTGNVSRERDKYFMPLVKVWPAEEDWPLLTCIVPVKEMEAWALADLDVLRGVVGTDWDLSRVHEGHLLGAPEQLSDPKRTLSDVFQFSVRPRRTPSSAREYLPILGERVPLTSLRKLPSFREFEDQMARMLDDLGWTEKSS